MALPVFKETFDEMQDAPPSVDWAAAFAAVQDLDDLQRAVTDIEQSMQVWRATMQQKLATGLEKLDFVAQGFSAEDVTREMMPYMDPTLEALDNSIKTYATPLQEEYPQIQRVLSEVGGPAGKFFRKQVKRAEDVRVKQHNAHIDFYYTLLAFRDKYASHEPASEQAFSSGSDLGAFLRGTLKAG